MGVIRWYCGGRWSAVGVKPVANGGLSCKISILYVSSCSDAVINREHISWRRHGLPRVLHYTDTTVVCSMTKHDSEADRSEAAKGFSVDTLSGW